MLTMLTEKEKQKELEDLEETHTRIYKTDKKYLKKGREDLSMAGFLHFVIQFFKAKYKPNQK